MLASTSNQAIPCTDLEQGSEGFLRMASDEVLGDRLVVFGRVFNARTGDVIEDAELFFYQAGENGEYNSTLFGMPSFAKLRGELTTGAFGCYRIETIVPGNYPGYKDGKHIHVEAKARGYQTWKFEFLFEGFVNESLRKEVLNNNTAIILKMAEKQNGSWIVKADISLNPD